MAKKSKDKGAEDLELNMTPMIDVVFNLIIFFMIVTDMSQKELEDLALPDSKSSVEDKAEEKDLRIIVNINMKQPERGRRLKRAELVQKYLKDREVEIKVKGQEYNLDQLKSELLKMADTKRNEKDPSGANPSEVFVLIRCDKEIAWREVQWVMQACADPKIRIYKIQFATKEWKAE